MAYTPNTIKELMHNNKILNKSLELCLIDRAASIGVDNPNKDIIVTKKNEYLLRAKEILS